MTDTTGFRPGQVTSRGGMPGLVDKLYWRPGRGGVWHCFKRLDHRDRRGNGDNYISLCQRHEREASGGQACARPPALRRCSGCDAAEITRRGADESLPESPNWRDYDR